jgi:hypothetical protein
MNQPKIRWWSRDPDKMCTGCPGSGPFSAKVYLEVGPRTLCLVNNWGEDPWGRCPWGSDVDIGMYQKRDANSDYTFSLKSLSEWKLVSASTWPVGCGTRRCELYSWPDWRSDSLGGPHVRVVTAEGGVVNVAPQYIARAHLSPRLHPMIPLPMSSPFRSCLGPIPRLGLLQ